MNFEILKKKALKLRQKTFEAFIEKGEAHLGGSFSMIEILLSIYEIFLKKEDKFILSKAHASFPSQHLIACDKAWLHEHWMRVVILKCQFHCP